MQGTSSKTDQLINAIQASQLNNAATASTALTPSSSPTLTGTWIWSPAANTPNVFNQPTGGNYALEIQGLLGKPDGFSNGLIIQAGGGAGHTVDNPFAVTSADGTLAYFSVQGDGSGHLGAGASLGLTWNAAGNIVAAAPSSGIAVTVTAVSTQVAILLSGGGIEQQTTGIVSLAMNSTGADFGQVFDAGTQNWALGYGASPLTPGTAALKWNATGNVTIPPPSSGIPFNSTGGSGNYAARFNGSTSSGNSFGVRNTAGTTSADVCMYWENASASTQLGVVFGDGGWNIGSPTGGDQGLGTLNATGLYINGVAVSAGGAATTGTFTAGTTGLSAATISASWTKTGNSATLFLGLPSTITSNATTWTITGLPAAIQPTTAKFAACIPVALNNGTITSLQALVSGSTITMYAAGNASGWVGSGNKNYSADTIHGATFVYDLT